MKNISLLAIALLASLSLAGCSPKTDPTPPATSSTSGTTAMLAPAVRPSPFAAPTLRHNGQVWRV